jgi:uncharacterized small protein (DUF1192 family)
MSLGAIASDASAFGFGTPQVSSSIGQPLQMQIPLQPDGDFEVSAQCVRLLGGGSDGIPTLTLARLTLEQNGKDRSLRIESLYPVSEPILRVTVEAGCAQRAQREFTLLLDPPPAPPTALAIAPLAAVARAPGMTAEGMPAVGSADPTIGAQATSPSGLDLGVAKIEGRIGQTLSMQVPVTGTGADTLDMNCVRPARVLSGDGTPIRGQAKLSLAHFGTSTIIDLVTTDPVSEPALRVVLDVGCDAPVRREYGVLLEMPAPAPAPAALASDANPPASGSAAERTPAASETAAAPVESHSPVTQKPAARHTPRHALHANTAQLPKHAHGEKPAATLPPLAESSGPEAGNANAGQKSGAKAADHLVLSSPDDKSDAATQRMAEMDQRVKDLTAEISRLRGELAAQKQLQADVAARQQNSGPGWLVAILGLIGVGVGGLLLWNRRQDSASAWNSASWDDVAPEAPEAPDLAKPIPFAETAAPRARSAETVDAADRGAGAKAPAAKAPAPAAAPAAAAKPPVPADLNPLTIGSMATTPLTIVVTEVQANEPSMENLYTLFYDAGSTPPPGAVPPIAPLPASGKLDIDLDIPPREMPAKMASTGARADGTPQFTYEEVPLTQAPTEVAIDLDLTTNIAPLTSGGPATEIPVETRKPAARAALDLDLDLTTNIERPAAEESEAERDYYASARNIR